MEPSFYSKSVKSAGEFQGILVKPRQNSHHSIYVEMYFSQTGISPNKG